MAKITVSLSDVDTKCDHCGTKMSGGFHLKYRGDRMYIGRACLQGIIQVPTSGNRHRALNRVQLSLNRGQTSDTWASILESLSED